MLSLLVVELAPKVWYVTVWFLTKFKSCSSARAELAPKVRAREVGMSALVNTTTRPLMFSSAY